VILHGPSALDLAKAIYVLADGDSHEAARIARRLRELIAWRTVGWPTRGPVAPTATYDDRPDLIE
jgi:hypothetical protein